MDDRLCRNCYATFNEGVEDGEPCGFCGVPKAPALSVWYVNAYRITLGYGGPEEGGWWYSIYEPLASIPVRSEKEEFDAEALLRLMFPNPDNKSSVAPGAHEVLVCVEETVATPSPSERPHYE